MSFRIGPLLSLLLCSVLASANNTAKIDSLLQVLDYEIDQKPKYNEAKRAKTYPLICRYSIAANPAEKLAYADSLFAEYKNFSIDTSLIIAKQVSRCADELGEKEVVWRSKLMESEAYKGLGRYVTALAILDSLPPEAKEFLGPKYLYRRSSIFYSLAECSTPPSEARRWRDSLICYRQALIESSDSEEGKIINTIELLKETGHPQEAIDYYNSLSPDQIEKIERMGVINFILGEAYVMAGQTDVGLPYLLEASISDIRKSDRKYNSLPLVAKILYEQGDLERAYDYIICSLTDIRDSNAQSRLHRVNEALPIITKAYSLQAKSDERTKHWLQGIIAFFALFLIVSAILFHRSLRRLKNGHRLLEEKNSQLTMLKEETEALNKLLMTSSETKDDYLGELFNLCSEYINIITREHNSVLKLVKTGKTTDIEKAISQIESPALLEAFFKKFDKTFLEIFPNFVAKVNLLLKDDYKMSPPPGQLTPELRICALIKLGITETSRIAAFLHFSNQTVYNYRARIKAHGIDPDINWIAAIRNM